MSDKLLVNFWGASISADGMWAISAAVLIVVIVALARRKSTQRTTTVVDVRGYNPESGSAESSTVAGRRRRWSTIRR